MILVPNTPLYTVAFRLDLIHDIERSGVIPYVVSNNKLYFLMAQDTETKELGDFGGGRKSRESALQTAYREWREESRGIFEGSEFQLDFRKMCYSPVVIHPEHKCAIIFVKVPKEWRDLAISEFETKIPLGQVNREICAVRWVSAGNFVKLIKKEKKGMWRKIREILGSISSQRLMEGIKMVAAEA